MPTDPPDSTRDSRSPLDADACKLATQVREHHNNVIDAELRRLARRAPSLRPDDLDLVDEALDDLAESLILARLRQAPHDHLPFLAYLLGT